VNGTFDPLLVLLSYLVAVIASYTALELARRISSSAGKLAAVWLCGGAVSMGIGIWTMHFVGMIAFKTEMQVHYDVPLTMLSLLVGILASAFAIYAASRKRNHAPQLIIGAIILGCGIAAMHYTGMAAMRMPAAIVYDALIVCLSIAIAIVAAFAALWIAFKLATTTSRHAMLFRGGAALVMGLAICGMHYVGMLAASYEPLASAAAQPAHNNDWLALTLAAAALFILGTTHLTLFFDYKIGRQQTLLKERNEEAVYLSAMLDESSNEIYVFDPDSLVFTHMNRGACESLGYEKEALLRMSPTEIKPEYDRTSFEKLIAPLATGARAQLLFETVHRRADGSTYPVEECLQLLRATGTAAYVAVVRDITERKNLESQLHRAQHLESIGQLAAGIAHEINTPTQFVSDNAKFLKEAFDELQKVSAAYTKLLQAARAGSVDQALVAEVDAAIEAADANYLADEIPQAIDQSLDGMGHIARIVRAMKEFSHPGDETKKPTDIHAIIRNVITVSSNEWKYVADVSTHFDETVPLVPCHAQDVSQALLNMLVNAAHAIAEKNTCQQDEKGRIVVTTSKIGNAVEIRLSDTGAGIPDEVKQRIFDPFFTTKDVGKGTGQGLSIAHACIVRKHGGTIEIETKPNVGSTFIVSLPLTDETSETDAVAA
jgi:PAS domain S-box-containing protein